MIPVGSRVEEMKISSVPLKGGGRIVVVDNFWANPDEIAIAGMTADFSKGGALLGGYPGKRAVVEANLSPVLGILSSLWNPGKTRMSNTRGPLMFSLIGSDLPAGRVNTPHVDGDVVSYICYLNTEKYNKAGTALYSTEGGTLEVDQYVPAKFNRVVLFPGNTPHSALVSDEDIINYSKVGRLTLNAFLIEEVL